MKHFQLKLFLLFSIISLLLFIQPVFAEELTADQINKDMAVQAHVQNLGWQNPVLNGDIVGTTGQRLGIEAIKVNSNLVKVNVRAHVRNLGWQNPVTNDQEAGTTGQNLPIEAFSISVENAPNIDLYYRAHAANFGWLGWAKNGEDAGTTGCGFPIEAIQIVAVPKDSGAPNNETTDHALIDVSEFNISLTTHVTNLGWVNPVAGGESGTIGRQLTVQAIEFKVEDPLGMSGAVGQAYISEIGWQDTKLPNQAIGTTGQNLPIEAFRYYLVGPAAQVYGVNYRAHVSHLGWLGTTSQNGIAGTANGGIPVECVDIRLVKKGGEAVDPNSFRLIDTPLGIVPPGPTCIVINKALQRMALYQNYNVTINTNVVTGMQWCDDTLAGNFKVEEKLPFYRTKGPGYDAVVDYWLTLYVGYINGFDGGTIIDRVGIHDADWRTDWAPNAYLYNGSHGCINTPYNAMKLIYNSVSVGTPVSIR